MKTWEKYSQYLSSGEWHIHTSYTDGKNTIEEYCNNAEKLGIPLLAFTEHVRLNLDYDFYKFLEDIDVAKNNHPDLIILSGCETKVLPDGTLDVSEDVLSNVEYPIFAYHSFPKNSNLIFKTLKEVITTYPINTWAHPGLFLTRHNLSLSDDNINQILQLMSHAKVLLEINRTHQVPCQKWIKLAIKKNVNLVRGDDCHDIQTLTQTKLM